MRNHDDATRQFIQGLRAVAALYESNPYGYYDGMTISLSMYAGGRTASETLNTLAVGECEQLRGRNHMAIAKKFSEKVKVEVFARAPESAAAKPLLLP